MKQTDKDTKQAIAELDNESFADGSVSKPASPKWKLNSCEFESRKDEICKKCKN